MALRRRIVEAPDAPSAVGGYAQAVEVEGASRLLFISGQVPADSAEQVPPQFADQCRLAWANVEAQLRAAGMTLDDLVKVTIFLSDRAYRLENREIRQQVLAARKIAMTVIIAEIFDDAWLLEIEGIAAA